MAFYLSGEHESAQAPSLISPFQQHALESFPGSPPIFPDFRVLALPGVFGELPHSTRGVLGVLVLWPVGVEFPTTREDCGCAGIR